MGRARKAPRSGVKTKKGGNMRTNTDDVYGKNMPP